MELITLPMPSRIFVRLPPPQVMVMPCGAMCSVVPVLFKMPQLVFEPSGMAPGGLVWGCEASQTSRKTGSCTEAGLVSGLVVPLARLTVLVTSSLGRKPSGNSTV